MTFKNEDDEDEVHTSTVAKSLVTDITGIHFVENMYQAKVDPYFIPARSKSYIIKTPEMYITLTYQEFIKTYSPRKYHY